MGAGGRNITANLSPVWAGRQEPVSKDKNKQGEGRGEGGEKKDKRGEREYQHIDDRFTKGIQYEIRIKKY